MGDRQRLLCRGLGQCTPEIHTVTYSLDAIIQDIHSIFYDLDAKIIWLRRIQYLLDAYMKCSCSRGYSLDCIFREGRPYPTKVATYGVYKVKVPEYDEYR